MFASRLCALSAVDAGSTVTATSATSKTKDEAAITKNDDLGILPRIRAQTGCLVFEAGRPGRLSPPPAVQVMAAYFFLPANSSL
jgi:hypothetical protein